ncbi:hypothetical protein [Sinorhizobium alkalisoli]|uniref:hypothetical protein n=1 Tax=Sinorhizobium alkalisoli TaxID=1752398 RepID=UPI00124ED55C|nr:hypothetical protein [Sinorhizobium alkalisoli]QFI65399.1 hypothetical protein EKH55_0525 [Sinorhizobium alkalisoli]
MEAAVEAAPVRGQTRVIGQPDRFGWLALLTQMIDWTAGCIAVTVGEMNEIGDMVPDNPVMRSIHE